MTLPVSPAGAAAPGKESLLEAPAPTLPASRSAWLPWWIALGLWSALAIFASIVLWHLHRDALEGQARELDLLSLALTDEIDRGLRGAEAGLHALRTELREGRLVVRDGAAASRALQTRADLMPLVETLWLVDHEGRVRAASDTAPLPPSAAFAPRLAALADDALAVSRPFVDPRTGEAMVALALGDGDMSPSAGGGWIVAALPAKELLGAFSAAQPAVDARMAVYRADGVRLAGSIVAGPTLDEAAIAQRLANLPPMEQRRFRDGSEHLVSRHDLARYGMTVVLTRDLAAMLVAWRDAAILTAVGLVLMLSVLALAVRHARRADLRRAQAQAALQSQITRASKLESLGTLAGGVAHDFNNVLAAIVGYGEMAQDAATSGSSQARHLDKAMQAANRGRALVERILAFSRGGARASTVFELEAVVDEVLTLLAGSLRPGVVLERSLEAPGARLRGDPTQAFEAVMNLCTNAMQAMPTGGMVGIALRRLHVGAPRVLSHTQLVVGDYLVLSVSDEGGGIAPDVMEHLFEPFFTTRGAQSGTGLGLAVVHGVVAEFGGAIDVQSVPRQGARFTLYLPECTNAADAAAPAPAAAPAGAGQRLMVVDDEPELLALVQETLAALGYAPIGFDDAAAALRALRADPEGFAALITDEVMPGLSGTRLTEAARGIAPALPVLLVSGYGGALLAQRAAEAGVTRVLNKPLQRAELARALAELLR